MVKVITNAVIIKRLCVREIQRDCVWQTSVVLPDALTSSLCNVVLFVVSENAGLAVYSTEEKKKTCTLGSTIMQLAQSTQ